MLNDVEHDEMYLTAEPINGYVIHLKTDDGRKVADLEVRNAYIAWPEHTRDQPLKDYNTRLIRDFVARKINGTDEPEHVSHPLDEHDWHNTTPISPEEMVRMFGLQIPQEAIEMVFSEDESLTLGEVRDRLRHMALEHGKTKQG